MSWELLESDKILKPMALSDFINTETIIPKELLNFFGAEGERLVTIYQGREFPAYLETEGGNTKIKWSKVLIRKFREAFPQYESWFGADPDEIKTPRLEIIKTNDAFNIYLITENEKTKTNEDEKQMERTKAPIKTESGLKKLLNKWITGYPNYYPRDFRFSFKDVINEEIPRVIESFEAIKAGKYKVQGFAGDKQWTEIPWIKVKDYSIQKIIDDGLYLAYILAMDSRKLYLAIVYEENGAGVRSLSEKAAEFRAGVSTGNYQTNHKEVLLGRATLVSGIVCYREYSEELPEDNVLEAEFEDFRKMYHACVTMNYTNEEINSNDESGEELFSRNILLSDENEKEVFLNRSEEKEHIEQTVQVEIERSGNENNEVSGEVDERNQRPDVGLLFEATVGASGIDDVKHEPQEYADIDLEDVNKSDVKVIQVQKKTILENPEIELETKDRDAVICDKKETKEFPVEETNFLKQTLKYYPMKNESLTPYLQSVQAKMGNKGFYYPAELIKRYYLSIKSKPFVMIKGRVGSGKTSFPRLFAEAIGAIPENGRYQRTVVEKNWEDERHLFGTLDSRGHFIPGPVMKLLKSAKEYPEKPHFFLLDEMDQSPVEDYFRLFLEGINGNKDTFLEREDFGSDITAFREYGGLRFPDNLYIIGTINEGQGNYPVSPRVIDSGNIIEMPVVEIGAFPNYGSPIGERDWENSQFKMQKKAHGLPEILERLMHLLNEVQKLLISFNRPMGYRGKNEILAFGINNGVEGLFTENEVIDLAIVQRILPALDFGAKENADVFKALTCFLLEDSIKESLLKQNSLEGFCALYKKLLDAEAIPCPRSGQQILKRLKNIMH